jgi:hypothetical protein
VNPTGYNLFLEGFTPQNEVLFRGIAMPNQYDHAFRVMNDKAAHADALRSRYGFLQGLNDFATMRAACARAGQSLAGARGTIATAAPPDSDFASGGSYL